MPRDENQSNQYGPSWDDVYEYVARLEAQFDRTIFLQMRLFKAGKPERLCGSASAHAVPPTQPLQSASHIGVHGFKGQSGAKTAPGAYWFALLDLEDKLDKRRLRAEQLAAF